MKKNDCSELVDLVRRLQTEGRDRDANICVRALYFLKLNEARVSYIRDLEAALKPFADASDLHLGSDDMPIAFCIIIGNLRQARKVLGEKDD